MGLLCRLFGHTSKPYVPAGGPRDVPFGTTIYSVNAKAERVAFIQGTCLRCGERLVLARVHPHINTAIPDETVIEFADKFYADPVGLI